jgi:hypothetical protein
MKNNRVAKLNFTGRYRIFQDSFTLLLGEASDGKVVLQHDLRKLSVSRSDAEKPILASTHDMLKSARIYIEVRRKMYYSRFYFGTPQSIAPPKDLYVALGALDCARAQARVILVDSSGSESGKPPKILAEADKIPLLGQSSLLPVASDTFEEPYKHLPYRLEYPGMDDTDARVVLLLNRDIGESRVVVGSTAFRALLLPSIVAEILHYALMASDDGSEESDGNGWRSDWLKLGAEWSGVPVPRSDASPITFDEWVQKAKACFCSKLEYKQSFSKLCGIWSEGGA